MAKVRLLELRNTYKWGGGPDKTILLSAERHDRRRVETVVAYVRDARDTAFLIAEKARAKRLAFYEIEERGRLDLRVLRDLREIVLRHDINLVHSHDHKSDLFAYLLRLHLRNRRLTLMSTAHAWVMLGLKGELYRRLDLALMRRFDHLIAVSHATKAEMVSSGIRPELVTVIHNGIDTKAWSRQRVGKTLKDELGLHEAFPVVGYVGRIMPEKDLETWLRAAALVAQRYRKAQFVLVGEGKDHATLDGLRRLASTLEIAERVHFVGYREDLLSAYAAFDVFFLSSRREGLPNSILEAMAMGVPVVTTKVAGAAELVGDGQSGYIASMGDADGLASNIIALAANQPLGMCMGQAGRQRVTAEFSFAQRLAKVEELYISIVGNCARNR